MLDELLSFNPYHDKIFSITQLTYICIFFMDTIFTYGTSLVQHTNHKNTNKSWLLIITIILAQQKSRLI